MALFFAVAYLSHGFSCAQFGIMSQPLQFFMMDGLKLNAAAVSSYMAIMMLPWIWKPAIAVIIDFVPLMGYRKKAYLVIGYILAVIALGSMYAASSIELILCAILVAAITMSISTVLMVGMAIEQGRIDGKTRHYFRIQEIFYYSANIIAAIASGYLCHHFLPKDALHSAILLAIVPLVLMTFLCWRMVSEEKSKIDVAAIKGTLSSFVEAGRSPFLWLAGVFSLCWNFMPSFGVPLYFYESKTLAFSQSSIGQLAAFNAAGMLLAALIHRQVIDRMRPKMQLIFTSLVLSGSTLCYLGLRSVESAMLLEVMRGMANMFGILGIYCFAAEYCPRRIEVSVMGLLVGLRNVATNAAVFTGGQLFTYVFPNNFSALVLVSAAAPLLAIPLIALVSSREDGKAS